MLTDLGYAKRQIMFARACNGRLQQSAVEDALSRALDAIERMADAITAPTVQMTEFEWAELPDCDVMDDDDLEAIFGDAEVTFMDVR